MSDRTRVQLASKEEILTALKEVRPENQFNSFFEAVSTRLAGKTLDAEGVMMGFNLSLLDVNNIAVVSFEAAPRQFIRAVLGQEADENFITEVVNYLRT